MSSGQHMELYGVFAASSFDDIRNSSIGSQSLLDFTLHNNQLPEWTDHDQFSAL